MPLRFADRLRQMAERRLCDLVSGQAAPRDHALAQAVVQTVSAKLAPNKVVPNRIQRSPQSADGRLVSAGLLVINPPWTLVGELKTLLPELEKPLGLGGAARFRVEIRQNLTTKPGYFPETLPKLQLSHSQFAWKAYYCSSREGGLYVPRPRMEAAE